jgi:regulator of sigma E protease
MFAIQGLRVAPETTMIGKITADSPADSVGLMVADTITKVGDTDVNNWTELIDAVWEDRENVIPLTVERGGEAHVIDFKCRIQDNRVTIGFHPYVAPAVGQVKRDSPAYRAGIRDGAIIESINDTTIFSFYDIERIVHANPDVTLAVTWRQDGVQNTDSITPVPKKVLKAGTKTEFEIVGQMGVGPPYKNERVPIHRAFVMGFNSANGMITEIVSFLSLLFTGRAGVDALGGPILITQMAGDMARWGFNYLIYFLAFFSINLCIFNLLPILPFDGGHLALFLYEGVTRQRVNKRLRELLTQAGFVLLILLMVFVVVIDLSRCTGSSPVLF